MRTNNTPSKQQSLGILLAIVMLFMSFSLSAQKRNRKNNQTLCPMGYTSEDGVNPHSQEVDGEIASQGRAMKTLDEWWPNRLDLSPLKLHSNLTNPMDVDFDYQEAFNNLDYYALKKDIEVVLTTSQDWWPADWGHYGGFFIRMAWHSAGTYRTGDGRGGSRDGMQRFAPLNSWPDNVNLDKARRLLWPIKQKYGSSISWADLMVLAGNVALENMGFETLGFAGGREDLWEPNSNVYWGPETSMLADERYADNRQLESPLAAVQMGLIYVNPEGPNGEPDPVKAAQDIRETFGRMGMNDEETVALIAGGHTLGKCHGAIDASHLGVDPEAAPIEQQGLGWSSSYEGDLPMVVSSGLEVVWTGTPTQWSHAYLQILFNNEWELTTSPAGAKQWVAKDVAAFIPDAFDSTKFHRPMMLTTDLSLRFDPEYEKISRGFIEDPASFDKAFAQAWFKLTHRDMGPSSTYLGPEVPEKSFVWQDPIPSNEAAFNLNEESVSMLKQMIIKTELNLQEMVSTAWASASTYRHTDRRGGANGARIRLDPQVNWEVNNPDQLQKVLARYENVLRDFNALNPQQQVSMADLIVLGGSVGIEQAAMAAGYDIAVPFVPGRMDASQEMTDINSFNLLEPMADGFRNYQKTDYTLTTEELLVDKAQMLRLTIPEMTVLLGGMRSMGIHFDNANTGILTSTPGQLNNAFFTNLLDMKYTWKKDESQDVYLGTNRESDDVEWSATRADLIFGSNSELRAVAEVYASNDAEEKFVTDFINAWFKVMMLDRFDVRD